VKGVFKQEKSRRKSDAIALYQKRNSELRAGVKLPDNLRLGSVRFRSLADEGIEDSVGEMMHRW
jgi:hypothetical protein